MNISESEYLNQVEQYVTEYNWNITRNKVRDDTYIIAGTKDALDGEDRIVVMVVVDSEITTNHFDYLVETAQEKDASKSIFTTNSVMSNELKNLAQEREFNIIESKKISDFGENSFDISTDEISFGENKNNTGDDSGQDQTVSDLTEASENPYEVAKELEQDAIGNIETDHLADSETNQPIISYLNKKEQPHFKFHKQTKGFRIEHPDWDSKKTPYNVPHSHEGYRYLIVTNHRVLFVAGDIEGQDEIVNINFDDIAEISSNLGITKQYIAFELKSQKRYTFFDSGHDAEYLEGAADYIREII